jgi:hypothetical protein
MKVSLYARYASDNQCDASITDQLRMCRPCAGKEGWTVIEEYTDHAISGMILRPDYPCGWSAAITIAPAVPSEKPTRSKGTAPAASAAATTCAASFSTVSGPPSSFVSPEPE